VFESDYKEYCKFDKSAAGGINAFDLISLSSGLDLSGLFEVKHARDRRFTSSETVERVTERVREVGGRLGYIVEEGMVGGAIGLGKGRVGLVFEVWEIVEKLLVVEVKVVERGGVEFEDLHWGELKEGLGDVVLQWNDDAM
jgi:5'-AMP-activated protein kinase catalytic alpha subunit/carbon catabolite-derepressing protein kinase